MHLCCTVITPARPLPIASWRRRHTQCYRIDAEHDFCVRLFLISGLVSCQASKKEAP